MILRNLSNFSNIFHEIREQHGGQQITLLYLYWLEYPENISNQINVRHSVPLSKFIGFNGN